MKSKSRAKRSSTTAKSPQTTPCLPLEITQMCLRFSAQLEWEHLRLEQLKQIGSLRLVSRYFRDIFTEDLFNSVTLCLVPIQGRPTEFLDIVGKNNNILKHIRHVKIRIHGSPMKHYLNPFKFPFVQPGDVAQVLSQAPLRTLTIEGSTRDFCCPSLLSTLHALRSIRSLQTLEISGSAIPPFLVCGHLSSTRLKSIRIQSYSSPDKSTDKNLELESELTFEPDSILAMAFQPFADIEELDIPNAVDIPKYFPLHDFGSTYYPSNGRIPLTLPALRELCVGCSVLLEEGFLLDAEDYKVLGTVLSRAPKLETLRIIDEFWSHDGLDDFTPLMDQLPSLENLRRLELLDNNSQQDEAIVSISSILGAFPPVPSLKTLRVDVQWAMWNSDVTRAGLYFSKAWKKLQRALARPALASLQELMLNVTIRIEHPEILGSDEVDGLKEALTNLYARDGRLDVKVHIDGSV